MIEDSEMAERVKKENLKLFKSKYKTKPRVYYKNLYRYTKCFIGGSVAATKNDLTDCVEQADVILYDPSGHELAKQVTDNFGDFKFDNLDSHSGKYSLKILHADYKEKTIY